MTTVLCLFSFQTFSQVYSNRESSTFFFTVGMTSTNLLNDTMKYKPGILCNGGFIYTVVLSDKLNVGGELLYTGKSFKGIDDPVVKYRYFYLDVPLYLQYKLGDNIRFNLGGQYSVFTNSKVVVVDVRNKNGVDIRPYNNIKPSDVSLIVGTEIDLAENIALAVRYSLSLSTLAKTDQIGFGVFQLSFNYAVYRSHKQFLNRNKGANNE